MKIDISREIVFRTARSGGKGGQNVNKVETMVEGIFDPAASSVLSVDQKQLIIEKLKNKMTNTGLLIVKSQRERSQLANKEDVIEKINRLIEQALKKKKMRIATAPTKGSKEKRIQGKKIKSQTKSGRRKVDYNDL
jgi:ribosome-associated protein